MVEELRSQRGNSQATQRLVGAIPPPPPESWRKQKKLVLLRPISWRKTAGARTTEWAPLQKLELAREFCQIGARAMEEIQDGQRCPLRRYQKEKNPNSSPSLFILPSGSL